MNAIGLCSHYSRQGDWAFHYAFGLAKAKDVQLNVFHWLDSPFRYRRDYVYTDEKKSNLVRVSDELIAKKELELREYYDFWLGDFVNVGFRLCEGNEGAELLRCLHRREYDLLVLGYPEQGADFGGEPIEKFAAGFRVPVVMVGPNKPNEYHLNQRAAAMVDDLGLANGQWRSITT